MYLKNESLKTNVVNNLILNYSLYLPKNYNEKDDFPLVIYLHGAGERGDDLNRLTVHALPKLLSEKDDFPFIAICPLCPSENWWPELTENVNLLIDYIIDNYKVNTKKVYLTGISMGGYGTWKLGAEHSEKFAALIPICGGPWYLLFHEKLCHLKDMPIWTFHGEKDDTVPVEGTISLVENLKKLGNSKVKLTLYPELYHNSWDTAYNTKELYTWMLEQSK